MRMEKSQFGIELTEIAINLGIKSGVISRNYFRMYRCPADTGHSIEQ